MRWLFPGKTVRFETTCLDCGAPIVITMKDEEVLAAEPEGIVGYSSSPIGVFGAGRDFR